MPRDWVMQSRTTVLGFLPTRQRAIKKSQKKLKKRLDKQLNRCYNKITKNKENKFKKERGANYDENDLCICSGNRYQRCC